jgi:hypothetical protein
MLKKRSPPTLDEQMLPTDGLDVARLELELRLAVARRLTGAS